MFLFICGFVAGWWACNWYIQNDRSFERAFLTPAQEALSDATENGSGRGRPRAATASRRARRA
jgi:hypothetical protein